ncbi:MAG TPA: SDR family oxidoreductase [Polyangiaceae bacterium]|nr:SDR family oxidoreductase [Polyangiaceae bacterium]
MPNTALVGKRVVITGGSSGMGLACARRVVESGGEVTLVARRVGALDQAVAELGPRASRLALDVGREADVAAAFADIGPFDHLLTAAAGNVVGTVRGLNVADVRSFFESKLWGQYLCAKYGVERMREGGSITLFSGAGSRRVFPGFVAVGVSEAAIEALTRYLAHEFAPIRVNAVVPGVVETPLTAALPDWQRLKEATAAALPVRRVGRPEDVADACLLLMTNGFMSGSVVDVDGGHGVL